MCYHLIGLSAVEGVVRSAAHLVCTPIIDYFLFDNLLVIFIVLDIFNRRSISIVKIYTNFVIHYLAKSIDFLFNKLGFFKLSELPSSVVLEEACVA